MPAKKLMPRVCRFSIHPKPHPYVPAAREAEADSHFSGDTLADRRKSVQVYSPWMRVVLSRPKLSRR